MTMNYKIVLAAVAIWVSGASASALAYEYVIKKPAPLECPAPDAPRLHPAPFVYEEPARKAVDAAGA